MPAVLGGLTANKHHLWGCCDLRPLSGGDKKATVLQERIIDAGSSRRCVLLFTEQELSPACSAGPWLQRVFWCKSGKGLHALYRAESLNWANFRKFLYLGVISGYNLVVSVSCMGLNFKLG